MVPRHGEDEFSLLYHVTGEQTGPVAREVQAVFQSDEVGAFRGRSPIPGARSGRHGLDVLDAPALELPDQQGLCQRAPADVAGTNQEHLAHGAALPARRRSSDRGKAPSRTSRGSLLVQSTTVEGGTFPSTPPSSTSREPLLTTSLKASTTPVAPGAGGPPGRLAEVDVSGNPSAATSRI